VKAPLTYSDVCKYVIVEMSSFRTPGSIVDIFT